MVRNAKRRSELPHWFFAIAGQDLHGQPFFGKLCIASRASERSRSSNLNVAMTLAILRQDDTCHLRSRLPQLTARKRPFGSAEPIHGRADRCFKSRTGMLGHPIRHDRRAATCLACGARARANRDAVNAMRSAAVKRQQFRGRPLRCRQAVGSPRVSVPVLSKTTVSTSARRSSAPPSLTMMPCSNRRRAATTCTMGTARAERAGTCDDQDRDGDGERPVDVSGCSHPADERCQSGEMDDGSVKTGCAVGDAPVCRASGFRRFHHLNHLGQEGVLRGGSGGDGERAGQI